MGLSKHKIGEFVRPVAIKCGDPKCDTVSGINIDKQLIPSRYVGEDTSKYSVVPPMCFAFNLMHVGRDEKIPVALNDKENDVVVSPAYFVFEVTDESIILRRYFYIIMSSPEFDRFAWFCTDSSIRGNLEWSRFCEIELELPDITIQQKYVDIYNAMQLNLNAYEAGLEQLRCTCDAYIEKLIAQMPKTEIGPYIELVEEKNTDLQYKIEDVRGVSIEKKFIETKANMVNVSLAPYLVVRPKCYAYVTVTSRNGEKISIAYNDTDETFIVSSSYVAFRVNDNSLLPDYLFMFLCRSDFDRYARFNSWGSARETLAWDDLGRFQIPLPDVEIQQDIVEIFTEYNNRRRIADRLKNLQKSICPILIKGALEESQRK